MFSGILRAFKYCLFSGPWIHCLPSPWLCTTDRPLRRIYGDSDLHLDYWSNENEKNLLNFGHPTRPWPRTHPLCVICEYSEPRLRKT